jgi:2'-5' RNA ligase
MIGALTTHWFEVYRHKSCRAGFMPGIERHKIETKLDDIECMLNQLKHFKPHTQVVMSKVDFRELSEASLNLFKKVDTIRHIVDDFELLQSHTTKAQFIAALEVIKTIVE